MKAYLSFEEFRKPGQKTRTWFVRSVQTGVDLAVIKWRAPWRRYCLYTANDVVFDEKCLHEVVVFLRAAMAEHCKDLEKAKKARF